MSGGVRHGRQQTFLASWAQKVFLYLQLPVISRLPVRRTLRALRLMLDERPC